MAESTEDRRRKIYLLHGNEHSGGKIHKTARREKILAGFFKILPGFFYTVVRQENAVNARIQAMASSSQSPKPCLRQQQACRDGEAIDENVAGGLRQTGVEGLAAVDAFDLKIGVDVEHKIDGGQQEGQGVACQEEGHA